MVEQSDASCHFLRLPRELRDMIYDKVFESSRLRSGIVYGDVEWVDRNARRHQRNREGEDQHDWVLDEKSYRYVRPAANTLALLRTCRQIHNETSSLWLRRVLFSFETLEDMLNKLSPLPTSILSQIRHVRVSPAHSGIKRYPMASVLKVLPALDLDTLTVVMNYASRGRQNCPENGAVVDDLVRYGMGWRKLYFVTADSLMLTSLRFDLDGIATRPAQPAGWTGVLAGREWPESSDEAELRQQLEETNGRCRIYRAIDGQAGAILDPKRRKVFSQPSDEETKAPEWMAVEDRIERKEARAQAADEARGLERGDKAREMMVVVERRRQADVVERGSEPYSFSTDFRAWMGGKSWGQYWSGNHHITATHNSEDIVDEYDNPFEFDWVASERKGVTWPVNPPELVVA